MEFSDYLLIFVGIIFLGFAVLTIAYFIIVLPINLYRGNKQFVILRPEEQLHLLGKTNLGESLSLTVIISPFARISLVYDEELEIIYFINATALRSLRNYQYVEKNQVLDYEIAENQQIIIKTKKIQQPIIRIICLTSDCVEQLMAAMDLIMSNQPLTQLSSSKIRE